MRRKLEALKEKIHRTQTMLYDCSSDTENKKGLAEVSVLIGESGFALDEAYSKMEDAISLYESIKSK